MALGLTGFERGDQICAGFGGSSCALGDFAHNREDRAFDRTLDCAVRSCGGNGKRLGPNLSVFAASSTFGAHGVGQASKDLGHDHTRVTAGTHERAMADRLADLVEIFGTFEFGAYRLKGQRHVRAGVAVGNGVHIERVDHFLMTKKQVAEGRNDRLNFSRAKSLGHRHGGNRRRLETNLNL